MLLSSNFDSDKGGGDEQSICHKKLCKKCKFRISSIYSLIATQGHYFCIQFFCLNQKKTFFSITNHYPLKSGWKDVLYFGVTIRRNTYGLR
jgi:hypothetical protein